MVRAVPRSSEYHPRCRLAWFFFEWHAALLTSSATATEAEHKEERQKAKHRQLSEKHDMYTKGHDMPHGEAHLPADGSWRALNGNSRKKSLRENVECTTTLPPKAASPNPITRGLWRASDSGGEKPVLEGDLCESVLHATQFVCFLFFVFFSSTRGTTTACLSASSSIIHEFSEPGFTLTPRLSPRFPLLLWPVDPIEKFY